MFPESQNSPTCICKCIIHLDISSDVAFKFGQPVIAVPLWEGGVLRATVPEAAIDEYGYLASSEDYVGSSAAAEGCVVRPISETSSMEKASNRQLRAGVSSAVRTHRTARPFAAGPRHGERLPREAWRDVSIL